MRKSLLPRLIVVALAVPVTAWLAVSLHNARLTEGVKEVVEQPKPAPSEVQRALRDLDRAERLNPDRTEGLSYRAVLHVREGRFARAVAALGELVRREPQNPEAWLLLASLTQQSDPQRSAEARARLRELDPRGARQRRGG